MFIEICPRNHMQSHKLMRGVDNQMKDSARKVWGWVQGVGFGWV